MTTAPNPLCSLVYYSIVYVWLCTTCYIVHRTSKYHNPSNDTCTCLRETACENKHLMYTTVIDNVLRRCASPSQAMMMCSWAPPHGDFYEPNVRLFDAEKGFQPNLSTRTRNTNTNRTTNRMRRFFYEIP